MTAPKTPRADERRIAVRLSPETARKLRVLAAHLDMTPAALIRQAITDFLINEQRGRAEVRPDALGFREIERDAAAKQLGHDPAKE